MSYYVPGPKVRFLRGGSQRVTGWDYECSGETATTYHEPERDTWTGLYDHNGTPLHRQPEPIGYNPHRWETEMKKSKPMKKRGKGKGC